MERDVYFGRVKLLGEVHPQTLSAALNYANSLRHQKRFEEARSLLRKTIPVARRVLGETNVTTLRVRWLYAVALYMDPTATLDELREAVTTLESVAPTWKRIFGPVHPETPLIHGALNEAREALTARTA
jgi:hypothetical protein